MSLTLSATATGLKRLFVAADVPDSIREELDTLRDEFSRAGMRPVPADQIHLTLLFLGDVEAESIDELKVALKRPTRAALPLRLKVRDVGIFSYGGRTTVGWAAIKDPFGDLKEVQENIARACRRVMTDEQDRPVKAHLTLARSPRDHAPDETEVSKILERWKRFLFADWLVSDVELFSSEPFERGRRYERLATFASEP
jgi:2'-5' RNA ligase